MQQTLLSLVERQTPETTPHCLWWGRAFILKATFCMAGVHKKKNKDLSFSHNTRWRCSGLPWSLSHKDKYFVNLEINCSATGIVNLYTSLLTGAVWEHMLLSTWSLWGHRRLRLLGEGITVSMESCTWKQPLPLGERCGGSLCSR